MRFTLFATAASVMALVASVPASATYMLAIGGEFAQITDESGYEWQPAGTFKYNFYYEPEDVEVEYFDPETDYIWDLQHVSVSKASGMFEWLDPVSDQERRVDVPIHAGIGSLWTCNAYTDCFRVAFESDRLPGLGVLTHSFQGGPSLIADGNGFGLHEEFSFTSPAPWDQGTNLNRKVVLNGYQVTDIGDTIGAVPEPATWAMMLIGFRAVGSMARRRKPVRPSFA